MFTLSSWKKIPACVALVFTLFGCSLPFYYPDREELVYRNKLPYPPQDIYFKSENGIKLHGWHFAAHGVTEPKVAIVQFHGNAENLTRHFISLYEGPPQGFAYMIFDYQGYGRSMGRPTPERTVQDGVAAIRWMHAKYPKRPLVVFGQSLGGAVAMKAVSQIKDEIPISLLVVDSTFPDYRMVARSAFARSIPLFLFQPLAWAVVDNSASPKKDIPKLSPIPLIVVHGTDDIVISPKLGKEVYDLANEPKEFWSIPKGRHIDFMLRERGKYGERLYERLEKIAGKSPTTLTKKETKGKAPAAVGPEKRK